MDRKGFPAILSNGMVVLGLWAGTRFLQRSRPVEYTHFILEDNWVEYGSFGAWVLAMVLFAWAFLRTQKTRKLAYLGLALVALFIAMEEISWGQRIIGWRGPELLRESNLQSETNLHNLVTFGRLYRPFAAAIVAWSVIAWLLTRLSPPLRDLCDRWAIPIIPLRIWPWFFLAAAFLSVSPGPRSHEVGELFLAMAVAVLALDTVLSKEDGFLSRTPRAAVSLIVVSIVLTGTALACRAFPGPRTRATARTLHRAGHHRLVNGSYSQAVLLFDYIADHPELRRKESQILHAIALRAAGQADEAKQVLTGYQESDGSKVPSVERAQRMGLALCVSDQQSEARALFEWVEKRERGRLADADNALAEGKSRLRIGAALLAQGREEEANRELERAVSRVKHKRARAFRAEYHDTQVLIELAGCL